MTEAGVGGSAVEIPAFAGMTNRGAGMMEAGVGR